MGSPDCGAGRELYSGTRSSEKRSVQRAQRRRDRDSRRRLLDRRVSSGPRGPWPAAARQMRPPLFLEEPWKQIPGGGEHPVTAASITNSMLLKLYGASSAEIQSRVTMATRTTRRTCGPACTTPCGPRQATPRATWTSGLARIKWNVKTSGFHQVRPIVKLADGTWLVGSHRRCAARLAHDGVLDRERPLAKLDPERLVTTGNTSTSRPGGRRCVGFVDLLPSSGHGSGGWSTWRRSRSTATRCRASRRLFNPA